MNIILLITYILLSTGGATLVKMGGEGKWSPLFTVPYVSLDVSLVTLLGIIGYGMSFLVFIVLLNRLDLSFLTPVATGVSYAILMAVSLVVFGEHFTAIKALGCTLILIGVLLVVTTSSKLVS